MIFERLEFNGRGIIVSAWCYKTKRFVRCKRDIRTAKCGQEYVRINNMYITLKKVMENCI